MDNQTTSLATEFIDTKLTGSFISNVIWNNNNPLFDMYFKDEIMTNCARIANAEMPENLNFEDALKFLKTF